YAHNVVVFSPEHELAKGRYVRLAIGAHIGMTQDLEVSMVGLHPHRRSGLGPHDLVVEWIGGRNVMASFDLQERPKRSGWPRLENLLIYLVPELVIALFAH